MFGLGLPEIIIILVAVGVFFFGGKKIVEIAHSIGRFSGEFKKGKREVESELKKVEKELKDEEPSQKDEA